MVGIQKENKGTQLGVFVEGTLFGVVQRETKGHPTHFRGYFESDPWTLNSLGRPYFSGK